MVFAHVEFRSGSLSGSERTGFYREAFVNTVWTLLCWFLSATRPGFVAYEPVRLSKCGGRCLAPAAGRLVLEHLPSLLSREPPVDLGPFLVGLPLPCLGFPLQRRQIRNPPRAQTLPREHAEFDLRLIEPTPVFRRVVHAEPIPDIPALLLAAAVGQRFAAVYIEVVHDEVDRVSGGVLFHDVLHHACELGTATVGSSGGEVPAALRLHDAKHVSRAAPFILVVLFGQFSWFGRYRRSHVTVQRDRVLIQADNGLGGIIGLLLDGPDGFPLLDVPLVQLGDPPHFFPATASTRGSVAKSGLSLGPRWVPTCV